MGRATCCEKVGLKRGRWTAEEDRLLLDYINANGEGSWRSLPKNAGLLRCGKSCRLRWVNYLRADLKRGNISEEEEETVLRLRATLGNRWSVIASHLPGRTDNEIKNYWNSCLSKKARGAAASGNTGKQKRNTGSSKEKKTKKKARKEIPGTTAGKSDVVGPSGSELLIREKEMEMEEVVHQSGGVSNGASSSSTMPEEASCREGEGSSSAGGECVDLQWLEEDVAWEEDPDVWRWLWEDAGLDLDTAPQPDGIPEDLFANNLDLWLSSDIL